jgi:23S rRNA pseudouridine1911/1915/1917 synthase
VSDRIEEFHFNGNKGDRLDKFLVENLPEFTRSRLQGLIKDGFITVDQVAATKAGFSLNPGQIVCVRIPPPVPSDLIPEAIPLEIIYEDENLMIVNKPAGMVVHPSAGHFTGTLVHAALAHAPEMEGIGGEQRPGVVHRLDKDTSGIILMAKNDKTHQWLQDQFRQRKVKKTYLALVDGHPPTPEGRVEAPIGRDTAHRKKMAVLPEGKGRESISEYRTVKSYPHHTLIEVHPLTGRTHQIRIHMAFLGCPVVGDTLYGHKHSSIPMNRHFLHAERLKIMLPGEKEQREFTAALPPELQKILDSLNS